MALLQDLIRQINDPTLRDRILQETDKLMKQKKFGLVFEEHLPECTPLHDVPIRVGSKVALKTGYVSDIYMVIKLDGNEALCDRRETHEKVTFQLDEIVAIAEFGEPIYPTLKPLDAVQNAPDSDLWHTLIGGQLPRAPAAGIPVRREGGLHLHRSAIQHRRKRLEVQ